MKKTVCLFSVLSLFFSPAAPASEVFPETRTQVLVRAHPKTGKNYVVIADAGVRTDAAPPQGKEERTVRPDYRMLEPGKEGRRIPYEGPSSSRTKVYVLAGSLAAAGAAAGLMLPVSAAAGSASGGGAGFAAAGTGVAAGTLGTVRAAAKKNGDENLELSSVAEVIAENGPAEVSAGEVPGQKKPVSGRTLENAPAV